jgi:NADH-quinone oxidoreductase subunit N
MSLSHYSFVTMVFDVDLPLMIPLMYLSVATMAVLMYGVVYSTDTHRHAPVLQQAATGVSLWILVLTLGLVCNTPDLEATVLYHTQSIDDVSTTLQAGILLATMVSLWSGLGYCIRTRLNTYEYVVLVLLATQGMMLLVASQDLVGLYLAIELQSLCFYVLAAYARHSEFAVEAGLKYFVLGAFSSGLLLFGASLMYGATGTTNLMDMATILAGGTQDILTTTHGMPTCELGLILITVGLLFKLAAAPFHMWSPDVYEGAPTSVTAYFMMVPKIAFMGALVRVLYGGCYDLLDTWQTVLVLASGLSMIVGAFAALIQTRLKRLLALSSVGHVGFMLAAVSTGTVEGVQAMFVYLAIYTVMNMTMFTYILGGREGGQSPRLVTDLTGLGYTQPLIALTMCVIWFSMAGIPPLAGFYSKAMVFYSAVAGHMSTLAVLGVLTSVVSCFYYIRVIKVMYFETSPTWPEAPRMSYTAACLQALGVGMLVCLMAYPAPLENMAQRIALCVCA